MKTVILAAVLALTSLAVPAFASFPPIKYSMSRVELATRCDLLGDRGEGWGLDAAAGDYGCRNTDNGNTVKCAADGRCTDYAGDPRWKKIQIILKGGEPRTTIISRP